MDSWILANALLDFFGIDDKVDQTVDATVYLVMALSATILFMIKIALMLLGGDHGDFDADGDVGDFHHIGDSDAAFSAFSLLSVLAFIMGTGWMGLNCRVSWGLSGGVSVLFATGFGLVLMLVASFGMYYVKRLESSPHIDVRTAVGRTAQVYLTIPQKGEGQGQVEVDVSGTRKVMTAVSTGGKIEAFTAVKVVDVRDDETLIVEPAP